MLRRAGGLAWLMIVGAVFYLGTRTACADDVKPNRFEESIKKIEEADLKSPPKAQPIVFVGSSSIRRWDVAKSFPDLNVINRGFGGSQVSDSVLFCERIVLKYMPPIVVFYAGDNDLAGGKTSDKVVADFMEFVGKVHTALPETKIVFISIKPSLRRWNLIDTVRETNARIKEIAASDPKLVYVDVEPASLNAEGKPRPELLVEDGLHPSEAGYEVWAKLVRPVIAGN